VAVYVSPSGASATSGGVFLVLASDVAAMAPVSNIGAAHPVFPGGENDREDIALEKARNDLAAFARSLAEHRGRNPEGAEQMVREARSFSAQEALEEGFVEYIATDRDDLLDWLDGRTISRYDGGETVLSVAGAGLRTVEMNLKERVLAVLSEPLVAFFLLAVGVLGIYVEITNPGALLPAVVGVICLLLFGLASQVLPVNWIGVGLIGLGLGLLILELKVASYGALSVGGLACLVIGGLVLFDAPPELRVPTGLIVSLTLAVGLIAIFLVRLAVKAQTSPHATGREALVGRAGEALTELAPEGKVLVHGEYYDARAEETIPRGDAVVVTALEGRRLRVRAAGKDERMST
jgi:membrane-bound serine protease (ClpP class)